MFCKTPPSFILTILVCQSAFAEKTYDPVIYGGISAGDAAAVQEKRMGGSAVIIEPTKRIGA